MWTQAHIQMVHKRAKALRIPYTLQEEFVQDVCLRAHQTFDPERAQLSTFLMRLADWMKKDFLNKHFRRWNNETSIEGMQEFIVSSDANPDWAEPVPKCMAIKPNPEHAIILHDLINSGKFNDIILNEVGFTTDEIAKNEKRSGQAIRGRLFKQRKQLRDMGLYVGDPARAGVVRQAA